MKYIVATAVLTSSLFVSGCVWSVPLVAVGAGAAVKWDQDKAKELDKAGATMPIAKKTNE